MAERKDFRTAWRFSGFIRLFDTLFDTTNARQLSWRVVKSSNIARSISLVLLHVLPQLRVLLYLDLLAGVQLVASAKVHVSVQQWDHVLVKCS